jgi:hypothetical protein
MMLLNHSFCNMHASFLVPQIGPYLFQNRPSPHKVHILPVLEISAVYFMQLAPVHRVPFQDPLHLRDPYLIVTNSYVQMVTKSYLQMVTKLCFAI